MRIVSFIDQPEVTKKILQHLDSGFSGGIVDSFANPEGTPALTFVLS